MLTHINNKQSNISYIKQDILSYIDNIQHDTTSLILNVCGTQDSFYTKFSKRLSDKFPAVESNYSLLGSSFLNKNLGYVQFIEVLYKKDIDSSVRVCNMVVDESSVSKNNKHNRSFNYIAFAIGLANIYKYAQMHKKKDHVVQIHIQKFAIGNSNWTFITSLIEDAFKGIPVFIYDKSGSIFGK